MYLRSNKRGKRTYYYIVESIRKGEKIIQKVICYLGTAERVLKKFKHDASI